METVQMILTLKLPGWVSRRLVVRELTARPWLIGMPSRRSRRLREGSIEVSIDADVYLDPEIREFIVSGAAAQGCDVLTFAKTVKKFPSVTFVLELGVFA
jgi:hypothetical protein